MVSADIRGQARTVKHLADDDGIYIATSVKLKAISVPCPTCPFVSRSLYKSIHPKELASDFQAF